jgi:two-component system sensor histidine kinase/response regulator
MTDSVRPRGPARVAPPVADAVPVSILVVDDNAGKRLALKVILEPLGYSLVEADSGIAALRCLMAEEFAVILLDVRMPEMDGFQTAALIRQRSQFEMMPIIFITALEPDEIDLADRYSQGAVDFIFAPVPPDELRGKVSAFANLFIKAQLLAAAAQEVQTSADRLTLLTDAAPIGIFQTDASNSYIYTNPPWSQITGISAEMASGQRWDTIIDPEQPAELVAEFPKGGDEQAELRFEIRKAGSPSRIAHLTSRCVRDSAGVIDGWVGTLADVTAEAGAEVAMSKARDEATEASRLKSDFLANMSHEIRTPMNGVLGMTDLLLETDLDARQRDYAQTVRNSGEALLTIINDILDFSKVEAGKLEIENVKFSPEAIVEGVIDLLAGSAQSKGLELVSVIERDLPAIVSGDPGRLRQVLTNLVGNAIKFTGAGEIVVRAKGAGPTQTGAALRFEVSDTGDGIPADKLDTVFQPFAQADTSATRKYGGTGLGLSISSRLVALMGGHGGVSSRIGAGSTFWFTIRVVAEPGETGVDAPSDSRLEGIAALIVDDSAVQRGVLSEHLSGMGMIVDSTGSGAAALELLRASASAAHPFAVVLIDRFMPEMDGLELIDLIDADPALGPRLVLMTNLRQESDRENIEGARVAAALSKPVHRDDLHASMLIASGAQRSEEVPPRALVKSTSSDHRAEAGTLLLAEDDLINQKVAVAMLSSAGYRVDSVLDGAAAVEAASAKRYDAILMDCQMPELNGYEATAAIRVYDGDDRHTPIIAMTAGARREDRERCMAAGMDGYLAKPVSKEALLALVAGMLS